MPDQLILDSKNPSSTIRVSFNFLSQLAVGENLSNTHSVTVSVFSGTDANPSALLSGVTVRVGSVVSQSITGGVAGNVYLLKCQCNTTLSNLLTLVAKLAITNT